MEGEVMYSYTAEQAMEDGLLIDVSDMAREAGFKWPVRITAGVHEPGGPAIHIMLPSEY